MGKEKKETPVEGIVFPTDAKGTRSTTTAGKAVWSAAISAVPGTEAINDALMGEKDWRFGYVSHLVAIAQASARSRANTLAISNAGLASILSSMEFVRDGKTSTLEAAMAAPVPSKFFTAKITGSGALPAPGSELQLPFRGENLSGQAIVAQVEKWVAYGCMEPDVADAVKAVCADPTKISLKGHCFVLIGAGSEMGPFTTLMRMGATVIATGTKRANRWTRLLEIARASPGTLLFPIDCAQGDLSDADLCAAAGCDLTCDTPELSAWVCAEASAKEFSAITLGCYVYMDGEAHVRASVAMDVMTTALAATAKKSGKKMAVAYLGSPGTCSVIPKEAHEASIRNQAEAPLWHKLLSPQGNTMDPVTPDDGGEAVYLHNGFSITQGPNYALAKTMQMWRAMVLREEMGVTVSSNMAPGTRTASMLSSAAMSAYLDGQGHIVPCVSFDADTSAGLMALLLLFDITDPSSPANPSVPLANPSSIFAKKGVHGGYWRSPWTLGSMGTALAVIGRVWKTQPAGL